MHYAQHTGRLSGTAGWSQACLAGAWAVVLAALLGCSDSPDRDAGSGAAAGVGGSGAAGASGGTGGAWIPPTDPFAPRIFFSDLLSGPNTGGQDDQGAFVTIYGKGFGAAQGSSTVTVGAGEVASYPIWTDTKITFQLGQAAESGDIVVHVPNLEPSNGMPFQVRAGGLLFVSTAGSSAGDGSFANPLADLGAAKRLMQPGDVLYAMDGVTATAADGPGAALCLSPHYGCETAEATAESPMAIVAYPGAVVTVGCQQAGCPSHGVRMYASHWTVAGLHLVGSADTYASAVTLERAENDPLSEGQRLVGNDITSSYYGVAIMGGRGCKLLGNEVHGMPNSAIYHGGWGESADIEIAWNVVHDLGADAFGIKAYGHTAEDHLTGLRIHHNAVYNTQSPGILVGGSDGAVPWVYDAIISDNLVWNVLGQYSAGIRIGNSGVDETELDVTIVHNTVASSTHSLAIDACQTARVQNNLFVQSGGSYIHGELGVGQYTIDHNGYFGGDGAPAQDSAPIEGDPRLVDAAAGDFHLQPGSPAIDSGIDAGILVDFDGLLRPQGAGFDLGAYEFLSSE